MRISKKKIPSHKLSKEAVIHYALFAAILLIVGAASVAFGSVRQESGYKYAGFALMFIGIALILFLNFKRISRKRA